MENGKTEPSLFQTNHGFYVVKSSNNIDGTRVLINEFVCYKLAKLLCIPIPDAALIHLNQDIIDADPNLNELNMPAGIHFGSQFIDKAMTNIQPPLVEIVENKNDIPSIILFDQIIYNNDRTTNKGNLLIDLREKIILAIDHSHTFKLGALWDKNELEKIHSDPLCLVRDFLGYNYRVLLNYVYGHSPFNKIMERISKLQKQDIDWCFEQLPEEWNLSPEDESALKEFIWYRIQNIEVILNLLLDQWPNWKGGDLID